MTTKTIVYRGRVAGSLVSWERDGRREVGYWLGKEFWGKGLASAALAQLLRELTIRPLYARVLKDNAASLRVLEKSGFVASPPTAEIEASETVLLELR